MEFYHFTEFAWPYLPPDDEFTSMRVSLPSGVYDPTIGSDWYNMCLDQHVLADELGINCMINEHHQTATCLNSAAPLSVAILARQTKKARLCILGNPAANLRDPVRNAEEMAMIDNISHGRLECGFVRGVPYELFGSNCNPTETSPRLWESIALMQKAWTTHDGPFNYEGRWVHKRQVNVWPRPYQEPHMPIWMTGGSDVNHATRSVENGFTFTMFLTPTESMKKMFTAVRANLKKKGLPKPADDLFAFMPLVAVGETEEEALKFIKQVFWYVTNNKAEPQFRAPPGYVESQLYANFLSGKFSGGRTDAIRTKGMDYFRENGVAVYGTPDQVVAQLKKMYKQIGGFGNLIAMLHSGDMPYKNVAKSMTLFAKEVVPQLKDMGTVSSKVGMLKDRGRPVPAAKFKGRTDALEAARAKTGVEVRSPKKTRKRAA
ncbi:MAG: LLM class flavin-dependent oxidoreductase [Rhodospirillaceae bacterium]|nr:LLM class flavin-dependent oxidoreductase [Rhodospirillaceae bacterium]|tara:strand:- start:13943 stop:15238 length:1296 start_codon:yes stop_codon:yes gene_type:complete